MHLSDCTNIFHFVYISQACQNLCYSDIQNILNSSRKNNLNSSITSVLIYRNGFFLQLLEGEQKKVKNIISKIIIDDRNHHFQTVIESYSNNRIFADWSMVFLDGDLLKDETLNQVSKIFEIAFSFQNNEKEIILPMLKSFKLNTFELKE